MTRTRTENCCDNTVEILCDLKGLAANRAIATITKHFLPMKIHERLSVYLKKKTTLTKIIGFGVLSKLALLAKIPLLMEQSFLKGPNKMRII